MLSPECQRQQTQDFHNREPVHNNHIHQSVRRNSFRTEFKSSALIWQIHKRGKICFFKYLLHASRKCHCHSHRPVFLQTIQRDHRITQFSQSNPIQQHLPSGNAYFMTHRRIESDSRAHSKTSLPSCSCQYSQIHMYYIPGIKYNIQRFHRILRYIQPACEIVTRTDRNITQCNFFRYSDPVDHFIDRAVSAQHHNHMFLLICCNAGSDFFCMPPFFSKISLIIHAPFLKLRFNHRPDHFSHT